MKTFEIENGDLVFDGQNNVRMVEGKDEEVQSIERVLTTNIYEWFLNINHGLNYSEVQGKGKSIESIRLAMIEAITQDERIVDIEYINVDIDRANRFLTVDFRCTTVTGNTIESEEVLQIG